MAKNPDEQVVNVNKSSTMKNAFWLRWRQIDNERRQGWFTLWQNITNNIAPNKGRYFRTDRNKGKIRNVELINNTPRFASRTLQNGMQSGLTSKSSPWFKLSPPVVSMLNNPAVSQWLYVVETRMQEVMSRSNFYKGLHSLYGELADFGTAVMLIVEDFEDVIRCHNFTCGQYGIANDDTMRATTCYREVEFTTIQLIERFGFDNCSSAVQSLYKANALEGWHQIIHAIEPVDERTQVKLPDHFTFREVYFEKGSHADALLRVRGYEEQPHVAVRWDLTEPDVYGWCPGMDCLGDCKMLQQKEKRSLQNLDKAVNPPMVAPTSMRNKKSSILPGSITYIDRVQGAQGFEPALKIDLALDKIDNSILKTEDKINKAYYSDLFLMMANTDRNQITAREIAERHAEKLQQLGPVLERVEDECLDPAIERIFNIMNRAGLIPEPPPELDGMPLKVEYISILAQAQKAVGLDAIEATAAFVGSLAAVYPDVTDKFNADQAVDEFATRSGMPPTVLVSDEVVAAKRQQRQQQEQMAQMSALAEQSAKSAKTLSEAEVGGNSVLDSLLGTTNAQ